MKLFICKINDFGDFSDFSILTPDRQSRISRYVQKEDKLRCLCAGLLLHHVLGEKDKSLMYNSHGKPYLPGENIYFNISHSGDYVVLVSDTDEIGVDIEKTDRVVGKVNQTSSKTSLISDKVAKQCLTADELVWLRNQPQSKAFYYLWTGKESIMKACGKGFAMSPLDFTVLPITDGTHHIDNQKWYLQWHESDNHIICIASKTAQKAQLCLLSYEQLTKKLH